MGNYWIDKDKKPVKYNVPFTSQTEQEEGRKLIMQDIEEKLEPLLNDYLFAPINDTTIASIKAEISRLLPYFPSPEIEVFTSSINSIVATIYIYGYNYEITIG